MNISVNAGDGCTCTQCTVHRAPCTLILSRRERAKVEMSILPVEEGADWGIQNLFLGRCAATSLQKGMLVEEVANRSRSPKFGSGALGAQHPENTHSGGAVERRLGCPKFSFGALSAQ